MKNEVEKKEEKQQEQNLLIHDAHRGLLAQNGYALLIRVRGGVDNFDKLNPDILSVWRKLQIDSSSQTLN